MAVTKLSDRLVSSDISEEWLAESLKAIDFSKIPSHQRGNAVREHLLRVMAHSVQDPSIKKSLGEAVNSMQTRKELLL